MSDLLSEKLNVYNQIETKVEDLNTISEATLDRRYENRPMLKPDWLKNFKGGKTIKIQFTQNLVSYKFIYQE